MSKRGAEELIEAISLRADRAAFAKLFALYAPSIVGLAVKRGASRWQADEIAQEVMLAVWRRAAVFDPKRATADAWIYTIARNRHIDSVRRERRPEIDRADPALVRGPETPHDATSRKRRSAQLRAAIDDLPPEQANVLRMMYFEHKTLRVIAEQTDTPLGSVKSRVRLALRRLRGALDQETVE